MYQSNLKHTMWNLKEAFVGAIPVFLTAVVMLFAKECHESKAIANGYNLGFDDAIEAAKEDSNIEVTEF